jgi:hypothetical protein
MVSIPVANASPNHYAQDVPPLVKCLLGKPSKLMDTNVCAVDSEDIALESAKEPVPATVSTDVSRLPMAVAVADVVVMINGPRAPFTDVAVVLKCATPPSVVLIQVKHTVTNSVGVDLWDELDKLGGGNSIRSLRSQATLEHVVTKVSAPRGGDKRHEVLYSELEAKAMPEAHHVLVTNAGIVRQSSKKKPCKSFKHVLVNESLFPFSMLVDTGDGN